MVCASQFEFTLSASVCLAKSDITIEWKDGHSFCDAANVVMWLKTYVFMFKRGVPVSHLFFFILPCVHREAYWGELKMLIGSFEHYNDK